MTHILSEMLDVDPEVLRTFLQSGAALACGLGAIVLVLALWDGIYWALSAPLRRQERARFFLDLLETGVRQGQSFEQTIIGLANTRDKSLGVLFYLVAAYVEAGDRLEEALKQVPGFLPRRLNAFFQTGRELGNSRSILPVCRSLLQDGTSKSLAGQNSVGLVLFAFPLGALVVTFFSIWILPRLHEIAMDMGGNASVSGELWQISKGLAWLSFGVWFSFWAASCLQGAGPRFFAWIEDVLSPLLDRIELLLPWRHKRLQRDFSALLSLLLDAEVPEGRAVQAAAQGTGNHVFQKQAELAVQQLAQGANLAEAMEGFDRGGEFRWRLQNSASAKGGFSAALAGWHEFLAAKAFAQEQAASQLVTTGMVFLNGAMVALVGIGLFEIFISIIREMILW